MKANRKYALAMLVTSVLVVACTGAPAKPVVDTRPVGDGLTFLGMAGVLAALIFVFGKFITESKLTGYTPYILLSLLGVLALVVVFKSIPALIIPLTVVAVALLVLGFLSLRWK